MPDDAAIFDDLVNHAVDLQHYGNSVIRRMIQILRKTDADIVAQIGAAGATDAARTRLESLLAQVRNLIVSGQRQMEQALTGELTDLTTEELEFYSGQIVTSVDRLAPAVVHSAAIARPFNGRLLREWYATLEAAKQNAVRDAIRIGFLEGEATRTIVARLRNEAIPLTRRQLEGVVRTSINHFSTFANLSVLREAGVEYVYWLSILDGRTSWICRKRSNKRYKVSDAMPRPPAHINCRSSLSAVAPEAPSYGQWLRGQAAARQDEIMGRNRGRLFRNGELPVEQFVNRRGRQLTLDELRERYPGYWRRANLEAA